MRGWAREAKKPAVDGSGATRQGGTWLISCSTKYVRGREASEAGVRSLAFIANCNQSCLLQLGGE